MRWLSYRTVTGTPTVGIVDGETVRSVPGVRSLIELLDDDERLAAAGANAASQPLEVVALSEIQPLAPIPNPPSVRDFMAFEEHVANTRLPGETVLPRWYEEPAFYFTNPAAIRGPHDDIPVSPGSKQFDYEVEVAAVVGRGGSDLNADEAEKHIAGYTILVDWSARDLQRAELPLRLGPAKGKDSASTLGPFLVTPDELEPHRARNGFNLAMTAHVNGIPYSHGTWADIYWSFGEMLAYASRGTTLRTGDIVGSGTVGTGCILELSNLHDDQQYPWLRPGDEVRVTIDKLGETVSRIVAGPNVVPLRLVAGRRDAGLQNGRNW